MNIDLVRVLFYLAILGGVAHIVRRAVWGCWSHEFVRERDVKANPRFVCAECGRWKPVMASEVVKDGPAHQPAEVLGKPITKVTKEWPKNVREWKRSER